MQANPYLLQLHCGERPLQEEMPPRDSLKGGTTNKPRRIDQAGTKLKAGLWTSTYTPDDEHQSDWLRWCIAESFGNTDKVHYLLEVDPKANVLRLADDGDYRAIYREYGRDFMAEWGQNYSLLDWGRIAKDFDGFHLDEAAVWRFRYKDPDGHDSGPFYSWDAESTVWFSWCFNSITEVQPIPRITWDQYEAAEQREKILAAIQRVPGAVDALVDAFPEFRKAMAEEGVTS